MTRDVAGKKGAKTIRAIPPVMVLKEESANRLRFQFRSLLWGIGTTPLAVLLFILASHMTHRQDVHLFFRVFIYLLATAFAYSAIWSFSTRRSLEIDFVRRMVFLRVKTLFSETIRAEGFDRVECITVARCRNSSGKVSRNYTLGLKYKDGWIEYLGWSEFGATPLARAMELVTKIAPPMGIETRAPTYFEERPLKGNGSV